MPDIFKKILREDRKTLRFLFFLFSDAILIAVSVFSAFLVRFEGQIPSQYFLNIVAVIVLAWLITIPIFYFLKLYSFAWLYVSTRELVALVKAAGFSFLILTALFFILKDHKIFAGFPRSTLFITYFFIFSLAGGIRFLKRIYLEIFKKWQGKEKKERTLIVGAGRTGEQLLRSISGSKETNFLPVGFIDDDPGKRGILIHGIKVLGKLEEIPKIVAAQKIEGMIVAFPSAGVEMVKRAVEYGRQANIRKIKIVPSINETNLGALQEVVAADLLGREAVFLDPKSIEDFIKEKNILVTGGAGSIGSELCRQIIKFNPKKLFILDQDETGIFNITNELKKKSQNVFSFVADIRDKVRMENIFVSANPQVIFHAAAYKHVPLMEENFDEAIKNNILGTKDLVRAARAEKFIFISTDKAVNPTSIMGATKRIGEAICQAENQQGLTKFISVRFGNVLDSRGNVIQTFKEQIEKRKRGEQALIEITHSEMKRYFMTTSEACLLVLQASAMGQGGEIFVLDMGEPIKILDLAKEMIRLSGLEPDKDIPIVFTEPRPGEKFFEEILSAEEGTTATENQKIFKAKLSEIDSKKLNSGLDKLEKTVNVEDKEGAIKILKELIPNFKHG